MKNRYGGKYLSYCLRHYIADSRPEKLSYSCLIRRRREFVRKAPIVIVDGADCVQTSDGVRANVERLGQKRVHGLADVWGLEGVTNLSGGIFECGIAHVMCLPRTIHKTEIAPVLRDQRLIGRAEILVRARHLREQWGRLGESRNDQLKRKRPSSAVKRSRGSSPGATVK